jgi:RNA polymerase sigma-70 factor (ECF subfamily)
LDEVMQRYFNPLTRFAFHLLADRDAAEEVVQDLFARVWDGRASWQPVSVRAYLYGAVRNRALNVLKQERFREQVRTRMRSHVATSQEMLTENTTDASDGLRADADTLVDQALVERCRVAIETLTERRRTALRLRFDESLTFPQIAVVMGISTESAKQLVFHAVRALRRALYQA